MEAQNTVTLKPSELVTALRYLIRERKPAMVVGPPGCGKTDIGGQASAAESCQMLTIHPVLGDPTDGKGLPWAFQDKDHAVFLPFEEAYAIINAKDPLVVFIDDLGQALPAVQASWMMPVLARRIAGKPVPDCVTFLAATNRRGDKAGVSGILEPVKGRFTLLHLRSDLDDFCSNLFDRGQTEYGLDEDTVVNGAVFLRNNPELLNAFEPTADMTNSPTERNWVAAFSHVMHRLAGHVELALVAGRVGAGAASTFMAFLNLVRQQKAFSLDGIIADPANAPIPDKTSVQWCVAKGLASRATVGNFKSIGIYLERMEKIKLGEFATLCVRDAIRKTTALQSTAAFIELMVGPVGKLIQGKVD
jgi:hypothetical protein